jgi:Spy/CpxP family protein refolding chaperone
MSLKRSLWVVSALILSLGANTYAQQPESPPAGGSSAIETQQNPARRGRVRRHKTMRMAERLNLSESQRQQLQALHKQRYEAVKTEREELVRLREKRRAGTFTEADAARAKVLREQIREAMKGTHNDVQGILTPEQRAQMEAFRKERRARREERREHRREMRETKPL